MIKRFLIILFVMAMGIKAFAQVENVPIDNPVYEYLKEMQVKGVIQDYDDGSPNMSRFEVVKFLNKIESDKKNLSKTELSLLSRYQIEFNPAKQNDDNSFYFFEKRIPIGERFSEAFSNKNKHLYHYNSEAANFTLEFIGNVYGVKEFKPNDKYNSEMMDGGLRGRGTLLNHLGFSLSFNKGMVIGQRTAAALAMPKLRTDFKFNEDKEGVLNYDMTDGYLKYYMNPLENFELSAEFGREKITQGYGYGSKLLLSANSPNMDFFKLNVKFGILNYTFVHGSTVGTFSLDPTQRYSKYWAYQRLMLSFDNFANFVISDNIVYARPLEFAYLNPILFFGFSEKSLQDRDNKNMILEFQTKFLKKLEFQGSLFIDDDEGFAFLTGKTDHTEKIGYQLGAMTYAPFGLNDMSFAVEYTKIRPYVYTHFDNKSDYTAYGQIMGDPAGPNSDQIYTKLTYNFTDWLKLVLDYRFVRKGNNLYDSTGTLIKNVGGNVFEPFVDGRDDNAANFLEGERVNSNIIGASFRVFPIKNISFTFKYVYQIDNNITKGSKNETSFFFLWMNVDY